MTINATPIIQWLSVIINLSVSGFNFVWGRKSRKKLKENVKNSEVFLEHSKKQAERVQYVLDNELNYCHKCKAMLDVKK